MGWGQEPDRRFGLFQGALNVVACGVRTQYIANNDRFIHKNIQIATQRNGWHIDSH